MTRTAAVALLLLGVPAVADEPPTRKAGLWESRMSSDGGAPTTVKQCVDDETDRKSMAAMAASSACAKRTFTKTAEGYEAETDCVMGKVKITGVSRITGDFATTMRIEASTVTSGLDGAGAKPHATVVDARRIGDCEPGQKPGDMNMPDDRTVRAPGSK